jgi:diguanylate cyclase (GGDEF)-like protein
MAGFVRFKNLKWLAAFLLFAHLILRMIYPQANIFIDLILFNLIGLFAAVIAYNAPVLSDRFSSNAMGTACLIWSIGSFLSTWDSFFNTGLPIWFSELSYSLFYPLIFFAVIRSFTQHVKIKALELLDTTIITFGLTGVLTAFLLKPAMIGFEGSSFTVFISIIYPVGDIVILAIALAYALLNPVSIRSLLLCGGLLLFSFSDLFFIWSSLNATYTFGSITDDGWIAGLLLISLAFSYELGGGKFSERISSLSATISLIASSCLLGIAAIKPGYFPNFILLPGFITIALAFIRMSFALSEAKTAGTERVLARTDELTGLSNRRNFLTELEKLNSGSIFLLDLNGFKRINDSLGHEAGDHLLKQVAIRFSRVIPSDALLARLGGDEFGVIAPIGEDEAYELALALRATLSYPVTVGSTTERIDVSIGYTLIMPTLTLAQLLHQADLAMYEAKRSGQGISLWQAQMEKK